MEQTKLKVYLENSELKIWPAVRRKRIIRGEKYDSVWLDIANGKLNGAWEWFTRKYRIKGPLYYLKMKAFLIDIL